MAGLVFVNNQLSDKPGTAVDVESLIEVRSNQCPYVGRGGLKLEKAIHTFGLQLEHSVAIDIGASTGGFTDCMLQHGADRVYAIDVGYGQLDYKLRIDPRVVNLEKRNVRYMEPDTISEKSDFATIDVSFISLKLVFPVVAKLLKPTGQVVCLIKPQFEAGREQVGKNGIVRDPAIHAEVIKNVIEYGRASDLVPAQLTFSPMTGAKGNIEYLMLLTKPDSLGEAEIVQQIRIHDVIMEAHQTLNP